ncbi:MAG TPA: hypothetical protein VEL76_15115 [Gemmataceae bacterium]|nr:hypothetical protein [Gemmataceae bacterium]
MIEILVGVGAALGRTYPICFRLSAAELELLDALTAHLAEPAAGVEFNRSSTLRVALHRLIEQELPSGHDVQSSKVNV